MIFCCIRQTMIGLPDERLIVPMLLWARQNKILDSYVDRLLARMGLEGIELHPGYQLRVQTLGSFEVWRGNQLIAHSDWKRKKTRQLFQLLLINRNSPLDREQICEYLWPGTEGKVSQQNFKVALNALYSVLEPRRIAGIGIGLCAARRCGVWIAAQAAISALDVERFEDGDLPGRIFARKLI